MADAHLVRDIGTSTTDAQSARRRGVQERLTWLTDQRLKLIFLWPTLALLLAIAIFPLLWSLYLSFTDYSVSRDAGATPTWIGLANYAKLLQDADLWKRFTITGSYVIAVVSIQLVLGFALAMLLNRSFPGQGLIMTLMLIPMMLPPVVVALWWRFMYHATNGVINYYIHQVMGFEPVLWLTNPNVALWALIITDVWMWTPFMLLLSLAGLSAVPKYLYEAADVDRASHWFKFRHITLPMVAPLLLIAVLFRTIEAYKLFDQAFVMTGGGPGHSTQVASLYLYQVAFRQFNTGEGSAMGYIMLVVIIALSNILIRVLNALREEG